LQGLGEDNIGADAKARAPAVGRGREPRIDTGNGARAICRVRAVHRRRRAPASQAGTRRRKAISVLAANSGGTARERRSLHLGLPGAH